MFIGCVLVFQLSFVSSESFNYTQAKINETRHETSSRESIVKREPEVIDLREQRARNPTHFSGVGI